MARKTSTHQAFAKQKLGKATMQQAKGGYKHISGIPGGTGSTGLIDWGEIEVRFYNLIQIHDTGNVVGSKEKSGI